VPSPQARVAKRPRRPARNGGAGMVTPAARGGCGAHGTQGTQGDQGDQGDQAGLTMSSSARRTVEGPATARPPDAGPSSVTRRSRDAAGLSVPTPQARVAKRPRRPASNDRTHNRAGNRDGTAVRASGFSRNGSRCQGGRIYRTEARDRRVLRWPSQQLILVFLMTFILAIVMMRKVF
jgi:hypothetical protein